MGDRRAFEGDIILRDGSIAHVREALETDSALLEGFVSGVSEKSLFERFARTIDKKEALRLLSVGPDSVALVVERDGKIIGHAAFRRTDRVTADVGVVVLDTFQGNGLGTILLGELAELAHDEGVDIFHASVSPENSNVIKVVRDLGFPVSISIGPGIIEFTLPTSIEANTLLAFDRREAVAAVSAVQDFLRPRSIAVIGASRDRDSIGGRLFQNMLEAGFSGPVYPVNRNSDVVQSVTAYGSVVDCPGAVDLAIIVVPAAAVVEVAKECAQKRVKALVVISSGFAEVGKEGAQLQEGLVRICRDAGMRLIGPNCMGVVNTDSGVRLNAQFSPFRPLPGRIGFLSQSGALGIAVIEHSNRLGLGMSSFVSVGNKADISGNDLLEYWEDDKNTDLILLYLESFGNPRKFGRIARRVSRNKPIIAVKGGRSSAGFRATQSHTGALVAASDVTVDALFREAGVIRVDTLSEMFDTASLLVSQPVPKGDRVAILTNAGGAGIMAADASEEAGLKVPELTAETQSELKTFLSPEAGTRNPVDMIASATEMDYTRAIKAIAADPNIDAIVVVFIPPITISSESVAKAVVASTAELEGKIPVVSTFMASHGIPEILTGDSVSVPSYTFPEAAVRALARAVVYGRWLSRKEEEPAWYDDIRKDEAAGILSRNLWQGRGWLSSDESRKLLACYGIPVVPTLIAATPEEAGRMASQLKGRVALKGKAEGLLHKTEAGAVRLDLAGEDDVREAAKGMASGLRSKGFQVSGFELQAMVERGVELIIGVTHNPTFGPLVACGAGGTLVELLKDVSVRLAPVTPRDAREMLRELKTFPLLLGYRGGPVCDTRALEELIQRVSLLADDLPQVVELDLNPVIATASGASVVDCRVRLEEVPRKVPIGAKRA